MLLKDLCTPDAVCCAPDASALHAGRLMRQHHVGDVIVVEDAEADRSPIGVVTDRDIVVEVLGKELDPAPVTLRQIMRTPVVIASTSEGVAQTLERMKFHGVRRIPVVAGENEAVDVALRTMRRAGVRRLPVVRGRAEVVGVLSLDDLLEFVAREMDSLSTAVRNGPQIEGVTRN